MSRIRKAITFANVIAVIALFLAMGGGVYAASNKINGKQIKAKSLPGNRLKPKSVTAKQIKPNAITGRQIRSERDGDLPCGSEGDRRRRDRQRRQHCLRQRQRADRGSRRLDGDRLEWRRRTDDDRHRDLHPGLLEHQQRGEDQFRPDLLARQVGGALSTG